ncbi:MAG TPA: hypothetical protein VKW08_00355 [Xanthobacteraceae bacterium]|jgi:hypothetical protein|nr:hypothetical protein [Xanthobacteraceae bacterium]
MSIDQPPQNKMMTAPPAKKGFHFASDGIHFAEFIEAETIEAATEIYHRIKRPFAGGAPATTVEQSTAAPESADENSG